MTMHQDGQRVATLRDVAARAGVSISTASRALTGSRPVSDGLSARVNEAAEQLGYRANVGARSLRLSRTMTIGIVFERMDAPVYLDILTGLTAAADSIGYSVLVTNSDGDIARYCEFVRRLYERRVDALLLPGLRGAVRDDLEPYVRAGIPTLGLFGRERESRDIPVAIAPQDRQLAEAMARLHQLGHRRVLYLESMGSLSSRWRQVETTARAHSMEPAVHALPFDQSTEQMREELVGVLAAHPDHTAIFVHSRHVSGLNAAIRVRGESVPLDRSLTTFTDSRYTIGLTDPPLSSIHLDTIEFGRQSVEIIEAWLAGEPPPNVSYLNLAGWRETGSIGPAPTR